MKRPVFFKRPGFVFLGLAFVLSASSGVQAQVLVDVSKVTCEQFVGFKITEPELIASFLAGYNRGKRGDTMIVDQQTFRQNERKLEAYCLNEPNVPIVQAFEKIGGWTNSPR
jgi:acid stress chaperone HdeB